MPVFNKNLGVAYYYQGFVNIPVAHQAHFPGNGNQISVHLGSWYNPGIVAQVNRTANNNHTPRVMMGTPYRNWVQENKVFRGAITLTVDHQNHPNALLIN